MKMVKRFLYIIGILTLGNSAIAQHKNLEKLITISANKPIIEVLKDIEQKTGVTFSYKQNLFNTHKTVSFSVIDKTLKETLRILFENNNIDFFEIDNQIIIYKIAIDQIIEKKETDTLIFKEIITEYDTVLTVRKDTVYVPVTDTLIITKVDTVIQSLRDTIIKTVYKKEHELASEKNKYGLEVFFKTSFYKNNLEFPSDLKLKNSDTKVQTSTKISYCWTLGMTGTKSIANTSISIGGGISKRFDNNDFVYKQDLIWGEDTNDIIDPGYGHELQTNEFQYLTIPVYISRQKQFTEKISIGYGMGIWVNYLLKAKGISNRNNLDYTVVDINDMKINKLGADVIIHGLLTYTISSRYSVFMKPTFEVQLTPDFRDNVTLFKNRLSFGSILGVQLCL